MKHQTWEKQRDLNLFFGCISRKISAGGKNGCGKNSLLASTHAYRVRVRVLDVEALEIPVDRDVPVRIQRVIGT